jgi:thiamine phosphate synthase YjbQ (UPF0047 family)
MTSIEVPYSIAAALPTLAVLDITNEIAREIAAGDRAEGIAFVTPIGESSIVRISEREAGFFSDVEDLLTKIVPLDVKDRGRTLLMLLGPRTEQVPFVDGTLCLGQWQRVLLFGFDGAVGLDWRLTTIP